MDAAFDDPAESLDTPREPSEDLQASSFALEEPPLIQGLDEVLQELTGAKQETPAEVPPAPDLGDAKAPLDLEDIEALFEE